MFLFVGSPIYKKANLRHCYDAKYNNFSNIEEAKKMCSSDKNCTAIYDDKCDGGPFHLCRNQAYWDGESWESCIYRKYSGKRYF